MPLLTVLYSTLEACVLGTLCFKIPCSTHQVVALRLIWDSALFLRLASYEESGKVSREPVRELGDAHGHVRMPWKPLLR